MLFKRRRGATVTFWVRSNMSMSPKAQVGNKDRIGCKIEMATEVVAYVDDGVE